MNRGRYTCYKDGDYRTTNAIEAFEQVAAALKMDPTEIALKNDGAFGFSMEWINENVKPFQKLPDRDSLKEELEIGKAAIDWDNKWHQPGEKILPNGNYQGIGDLNQGLRILPDGTLTILAHNMDAGEGRDYSYRMVVADEVGMKWEDTSYQHWEYNGFETREPGGSTALVGNLPGFIRAARKLKYLILQTAIKVSVAGNKPFEGKQPQDLNIKDSVIFDKSNPSNTMPVATVAKAFPDMFDHDQTHWPTVEKYPYEGEEPAGAIIEQNMYVLGRQCYFMEVEVDPETGKVYVKKVVIVNDAGKVICPEVYEGMQHGGTYMGVGRSNTEQVIWDPQRGVKLNNNLIGYPIALINDIYEVPETLQVETGLGYGAYGTQGIGECAAAVVSGMTRYAVHNAIGKE
jgi:CO/xanthine dehydrogenase Mo-binding subunit